MIPIVMALIIGFIVYFFTKEKKEFKIAGGIAAFILTWLILYVVILGSFNSKIVKMRYEHRFVSNIVLLKNDSEINGNFFIGCGSINEDDYYIFYTFDGKYKKRNKVPVEYFKIRETNEEAPSLYREFYIEEIDNTKYFPWFFLFKKNKIREYEKNNGILVIPENTIKENFNIE